MKLKLTASFLSLLVIFSCKKDESSTTPPAAETYLTTAAGSSWTYHATDNTGAVAASDYTLTATSTDTTIIGKSYHVYTNSAGGNQYMALVGHDYYQFDSLPTGIGGSVIERLYLKDNVAIGTNWTQDFSVNVPGSIIPIPFTVSNSIAESGISRTVNGVPYNDVIHVSTHITSAFIPPASLTTSIDTYYAKKYGMIENTSVVHLDFAGIMQDVNTSTILTSATLK
ncbi:MAG: hypothetical protein ABIN25_11885 [Ginsengibacter sp.]